MRLKCLCLALLSLGTCTAAFAEYKIVNRFAIGGEGGYDYLRVDPSARRLFVSHGTKVEVLDADSGKKLGEIAPTPGVHGIAFAPEFNHGFISNGGDNTVTLFDLKTLKPIEIIKVTGKRPDALDYDADTKQIFVCNHGSGNITVLDADKGTVKATIELGGALEEVVFDGRGHLFVNAEDKNAIHAVDTKSLKQISTWSIAPAEGPTGLAIDREHHRLFAAAGDKLVVLNSDTGAVISTLPTGEDPDGATFEPATGNIFVPTKDGKLTIIHEDSPDKYSVIQTLSTQHGCRTIALDQKTGRVFMPTGIFTPVPTTIPGGPVREKLTPGTFEVIVVGK
jgi:DNA-binding beta-propeller fold protein YncE